MQHEDAQKGEIHIIHNFEFANITERDAYTPTSNDLNKICLVLEPYGFYALKSAEPIEWAQIGTGTTTQENTTPQTNDEIIRSNINPTISTNPKENGILWANFTTSEIFICTDNTINKNVWKGNKKTIISEKKIYTYDIFNDFTCIAFFQLDDDLTDMGGAFDIAIYNANFEIGKYEKCLKMNSTNSKIELYGKVKSTSFWAYFPETMTNSTNYIFDCRGYAYTYYGILDIDLNLKTIVGAEIYQNGVQMNTGTQLIKNQWVHIAINFNGEPSGVRLLNGYTQVNGMNETKIDHIRCFNRTLKTEDLQILMGEI